MIDACGWAEWLSPGQPAGTPGVCAACGLKKDYGGVKRCMARGRPEATHRNSPRVTGTHCSGIGDRLHDAFGAWWIEAAKTCRCNDLRDKLNAMTAKQVAAWKKLPDLILANVQHLTGTVGLVIRGLAAVAPGFARKRIEAAILAAIRETET